YGEARANRAPASRLPDVATDTSRRLAPLSHGADIGRVPSADRPHACPRLRGHGANARVVGVEHGRSVIREGLHERALLALNVVERAQELRVRARYGGDSGDGRTGDPGHGRDLPRVVRADR